MKNLIALLAILPFTVGPAQADIRYPNTAGAKFCELRERGVTVDDALSAAVEAGWDSTYTARTLTREDGSTVDSDVLEMSSYIQTMCPDLWE